MKYSHKQLKRFQIADLLTDIRCAYRDNMPVYAMQCEREVIALSGPATMNKYGYFAGGAK